MMVEDWHGILFTLGRAGRATDRFIGTKDSFGVLFLRLSRAGAGMWCVADADHPTML